MPRETPILTNFTAGELSPQMEGRVDFAKYRNGARALENLVVRAQGGALRRPGTRFVKETKTSATKARLIPFEFSTEQAYVIELGDGYARFYKDEGRIENPPGTPVALATPWLEADLAAVKVVQSADVLYVVHRLRATRKITRTSHTAWSIAVIDFIDGPYLDPNTTAAFTLAFNGGPPWTKGSTVTLQAAGGHTPFLAGHVGSLWSLTKSGKTAYVKVSSFTSTTAVQAVAQIDIPTELQAAATSDWKEGAWSDVQGFPSAIALFEQRLALAAPTQHPSRVDLSVTGDFEDFTAGAADDDAIAFTIASQDVQAIRWMLGSNDGLVIGTVRSEWIMRASAQGEPLTPTNVTAKEQRTKKGSADIQGIAIAGAALFVQRARRAVHELVYSFEVDALVAPDLTLLAEHVSEGGIVEIAFQQQPHGVLWACRADGTLIAMTYMRDQDVVAWHRHPMTNGFVESLAAIPSPAGDHDQLWMVVRRTIGGATKRYVEFMEDYFDEPTEAADGFFVDSGLSYSGVPADVMSGLGHLEDETVAILADGAPQPDRRVVGGQITLDAEASKVHVGLPTRAFLETMRLEAGSADGTAQGKTKRVHAAVIRFWRTAGALVGPRPDRLTAVPFRKTTDAMNSAPALVTGDKKKILGPGYDRLGRVVVANDQPVPFSVLAIVPQVVTNDL